MFKHVVSVGQYVTEADNFVYIMDLFSKIRIVSSESGQCLSHDFKLSFDNKL